MFKYNFIFIVVLLCASLSQSMAQVNMPPLTPEVFENAKSRTAFFILQFEDPKIITKLKKSPSDVEAYKRDVAEFNERLTTAVESFWKFNEKYELINLPDAMKRIKGKALKDFVIIQYKEITATPNIASKVVNPSLPYNKLSNPSDYGCFEMRLSENLLPTKPILSKAIFTMQAPKLMDMIFGIQVLQYQLSNELGGYSPKEINEQLQSNAKNLQGKILLINKLDIDEDNFSQEKFRRYYFFDWEIRGNDTITAKIANADPDYIYVKIAPTTHNTLAHYLISCEDGTVCGYYESRYDDKAARKMRINEAAVKAYGKYSK